MASSFFFIFIDEVTIIDNQSWIFVHFYVVIGWKQMPILLTFGHFVEGGIVANIKNMILVILITYGGLTDKQIFEHLMCLGADGVSTFQGVKSRVIVLIKTQQTHFFIEIHCIAHRTNLEVQNLSSMLMISKLEDLFQSIYWYFSSSPKCHFEFMKLVKIVETKGLKIF